MITQFSLHVYTYEFPIGLVFSQAKADEIAKLMNENEQLKGVIEELKVCTICFFLPNIYTCLYFPQIRSHL